MDFEHLCELQRLRPGESLSVDAGICVKSLDFAMVVFMINPTIERINVMTNMGQSLYAKGSGTFKNMYKFNLYLLYTYDQTEVVGYALRFFGGNLPLSSVPNSLWFASSFIEDQLEIVARFLPMIHRNNGQLRSCDYFWQSDEYLCISSPTTTVNFNNNAKKSMPFSEFSTDFVKIQDILKLQLSPSDTVVLKVNEVIFRGCTIECMVELSGDTFETKTGKIDIPIPVPVYDLVAHCFKGLITKVLDGLPPPKLELAPTPTRPHVYGNVLLTTDELVASLIWRANPTHALKETVNSVSNAITHIPFASIACALETRRKCSDQDISDYHDTFKPESLPEWAKVAYHPLELALIQSPKVTTNLIINMVGLPVTVRANQIVPSNF